MHIYVSSIPGSRVSFPFAIWCRQIPTSRGQTEESGSLGETENVFQNCDLSSTCQKDIRTYSNTKGRTASTPARSRFGLESVPKFDLES